MKVSELEKSSTSISARINTHFINLLKEGEISISSVVESMIGYFLTLSNEEKMKFLSLYSPKNMEIETIQYPKKVWSGLDSQYQKGEYCMETMREILMNASEEDLTILDGYIALSFSGKSYQAKLHSMESRYQKVTELLATLLKLGRGFSGTRLDYGEFVCYVAKRIDLDEGEKPTGTTDYVEIEITRRFIINNFPYIPPTEKAELFTILGKTPSLVNTEGVATLKALALEELPESVLYKLTGWVANAALQSFSGEKSDWGSDRRIDKLICGLLSGNNIFRKTILFPIFHMTMLRHRYRFSRIPKCSTCNAEILPGSKYCSECGSKFI